MPSDEKIFQMRDDERRMKLESREKTNSMTMWERADVEIKASQTRYVATLSTAVHACTWAAS